MEYPGRRMRDAWTRLERLHQKSLAAEWAVRFTFLAVGIVGAAAIAWEISSIATIAERGYGDSYILYDVLGFQRSGVLYRDLSEPPYLPAQYSPSLYVLLSIPARIVTFTNPFLGPRIVVLAAFAGCVGVLASIGRTVDLRHPFLWTAVAVASVSFVPNWVLQIRADFLGILFSLVAIRGLLSERPVHPVIAGCCAGLAIQFKLTYIAAAGAGVVWLSLSKEWRRMAQFASAAAITAFTAYMAFGVREPRMWGQLTALSPGVPDLPGAVELVDQVAVEPVALLAVFAVATTGLADRRWGLIGLYTAAAAVVAAATSVQAGANVNYYVEPLFASIPLAIAGFFRLAQAARSAAGLGLLIVLLGVRFIAYPQANNLYKRINETPSTAARKEAYGRFEPVIARYRTLALLPRIAFMNPTPPLLDPYLLSYLERLGRPVPNDLIDRITRQEFHGIITQLTATSYRGIPHVSPVLRRAIASAYQAHCVVQVTGFPRFLLHVPRGTPPSAHSLATELEARGCRIIAADQVRW
jgi:hypothetical protein